MTLMVSAPLVSWLVIPNRGEPGTRLWFAGGASLGLVSVLYFYTRSGTTMLIVANLAAAMLAVQALLTELKREPLRWSLVGAIFLAVGGGHELLIQASQRGSISEVWVLGPRVLLLVILEWWIVALSLRVSRRHGSRGMLLIAIGTGVLGSINLFRLGLIVTGSSGMGPEIGSRAFPVLAAVLTFTSLTYSFGFVAFALEKSWARAARSQEALARSQERERAEQRHSEELREVIAQRDDMLMQSTRLMTLRTMGLYNAAVVHEISQPLKALRALLDTMRLERAPTAKGGDSGDGAEFPGPELLQASELAGKVATLVQSLHRLLSHQQVSVRPVRLNDCIAAVTPVLQGQAQRLGAEFQWIPDPRLDAWTVQIEPLLMQRLVMNLVGNSLDALTRVTTGQRRILLRTEWIGSPAPGGAQMLVQDSGPGFADSVMNMGTSSVVTSKSNGMGMGLNLSRLLVSSWKGSLTLGTASGSMVGSVEAAAPGASTVRDAFLGPSDLPGASVTVWLPLSGAA